MTRRLHERRWRDLWVDEGLRDEWLEELNGLTYWKPYSTCEGHVDCSRGGAEDHPRVWLLLGKSFIGAISEKWHATEQKFQRLREQCFPAKDTTSSLHFEENDEVFGTTCALHLDSQIQRMSEEMAPDIHAWCRYIVESDELLSAFLALDAAVTTTSDLMHRRIDNDAAVQTRSAPSRGRDHSVSKSHLFRHFARHLTAE